MAGNLRAIVIGCGNMGASHARAYAALDGFELVGLVARSPTRRGKLAAELVPAAEFDTLEAALAATRPDVAAVCTYPDSHAAYCRQCLEAGLHVFVEKPLAMTVEEAGEVVQIARRRGRKLVVGYILRHHPAWIRFVEIARTLGKPLVMRMNLNQQSVGATWDLHKNLMESMSPIVDCGVHYVDMMCQMTRSRPVRVQAIAARLTDEIAPTMTNYGQLQVVFADGSVGWYEAGWGPMISEEAYFVKDVFGPKGSVSIVKGRDGEQAHQSANLESHTQTNWLRVHHADQDAARQFTREDEWIDTTDEPDHQELCNREQAYLLRAIRDDLDLTDHWADAVNSLRIVLAADEAARTGRTIEL
ncbi:MAG: putative oxidoreductase YcjS [candidate division BRC1 bacterium ADurb.BinA292]|nr:MAG: putative oxidoreductase YcjS [candidate division BRC1 bacterium ADurb.BinA292]